MKEELLNSMEDNQPLFTLGNTKKYLVQSIVIFLLLLFLGLCVSCPIVVLFPSALIAFYHSLTLESDIFIYQDSIFVYKPYFIFNRKKLFLFKDISAIHLFDLDISSRIPPSIVIFASKTKKTQKFVSHYSYPGKEESDKLIDFLKNKDIICKVQSWNELK